MSNSNFRRFIGGILLLVTVLLAGCFASSKPFISKDGRTVVTGAVQRLDGGREMIIKEAHHCVNAMTPQQIEAWLQSDRSKSPCAGVSEVETAYGTSIERDVFTGVVPVVVGNKMQENTAMKLERLRAEVCKEQGGCGDKTLIYIEGDDINNSSSTNVNNKILTQVGVGVDVGVTNTNNGGGCPSGNCPKPPPVKPPPVVCKNSGGCVN